MKKILLFIPFIFLFAACSQDNEIIAENDDSTNFPKEQKETVPTDSPHIFSVAEDNNQSHDGKYPGENKVIAI